MKIGILRFKWNEISDGTQPWSTQTFQSVFADPENPWSIATFWRQCTFGLINLEFTVDVPMNLPQAAAAPAGWYAWNYNPTHVRWKDLGAGITLASKHGVPTDEYDRFIVFVDPPPSDAGNLDLHDTLLDRAAEMSFFQHEVGHMFGLNHPISHSEGGREYDDPYCVMGFYKGDGLPGLFTYVPDAYTPDLSETAILWQIASRRPSTATLYRYLPEFAMSASVYHAPPLWTLPAPSGSGSAFCEVTLVAPSDAAIDVDVMIASAVVEPPVFNAPSRPILALPGEVLVEYRRPKSGDWDRAIGAPLVLIHSINLHKDQNPPGNSEERPVWFEGAIPATAGAYWTDPLLNLGVEVIEASADKTSAQVRLSTLKSMIAGAWIESVVATENSELVIANGTMRPFPIARCKFGEYPFETMGTKVQATFTADSVGIESRSVHWSVKGRWGGWHDLSAPVSTDSIVRVQVHVTNATPNVSTTVLKRVPVGFRIEVDGSLVLSKTEDFGAFDLEVRVAVKGENSAFGPVERDDEVSVSFPGDRLVIGGTYYLDAERCLNSYIDLKTLYHRRRDWPPIHDPGPIRIRPLEISVAERDRIRLENLKEVRGHDES